MQDDLSSFWAEYARIQTRVSRNTTVDSYSWGLEARLNSLLANPAAPMAAETLRSERISRSVARRERARRQKLQLHYSENLPEQVSPILQFVARDSLQRIQSRITRRQWSILLALSSGQNYVDIANENNSSAGAMRAQVFRLRQQLTAFLPAA